MRRIRSLATQLWLPTLLVVSWWFWSAQANLVFYPPLSVILQRFQELWLFDRFSTDVLPSLRNLLIGFAISAIVGIALGLLLGLSRGARSALEPIVHFLRSVPPVALVPLAILVLGFGPEMKIVIIAFSSLFATLIATLDGVRASDPVMDEVSRVYRLSPKDKLFRVILPGAAPQILGGLQVSLMVSFIVMITSEMLGSTEGIGYQTILAQQTFAIPDMWAGMLLLGLLGYLFNLVFTLAERRILHWYTGMRAVPSNK
jgi:ABC-type nitrate/sulfonate/bicarbonate transport system permease component